MTFIQLYLCYFYYFIVGDWESDHEKYAWFEENSKKRWPTTVNYYISYNKLCYEIKIFSFYRI